METEPEKNILHLQGIRG